MQTLTKDMLFQACLVTGFNESLVRQAYRDSGDTWTWSIGLTDACGHNVERYIGKPQPLKKCLSIFVWAAKNYAADVLKAFDGYTLTPDQFAAAFSFHWNTGDITTASWVPLFKQGKMVEAEQHFNLYHKPASIIPRRDREADLLFRGKWDGDGTITEYTKLTPSNHPDWSSGRTVHIKGTLRSIIWGDAEHSDLPETASTEEPKKEPEKKAPVGFLSSLWKRWV